MTLAEARTAIRTATETDATDETASPVTGDMLDDWINRDYKNFRRTLSHAVPELYTATSATQTLTSSDDAFDKPADYERLVRMERQYGTKWHPIEVFDGLTVETDLLSVREEGDDLLVGPPSRAAGTYRIVYVTAPDDLNDDADELDVPAGCEDIVVELVAARVRERRRQDPILHLQRAERTWQEQRKLLRRRYGAHSQPGLRITRGW